MSLGNKFTRSSQARLQGSIIWVLFLVFVRALFNTAIKMSAIIIPQERGFMCYMYKMCF